MLGMNGPLKISPSLFIDCRVRLKNALNVKRLLLGE